MLVLAFCPFLLGCESWMIQQVCLAVLLGIIDLSTYAKIRRFPSCPCSAVFRPISLSCLNISLNMMFSMGIHFDAEDKIPFLFIVEECSVVQIQLLCFVHLFGHLGYLLVLIILNSTSTCRCCFDTTHSYFWVHTQKQDCQIV